MGKKENSLICCHSVAQLPMALADHSELAWGAEGVITGSQFKTDVGNLTHQLRQRAESRWALCFDNSYQFAVALFACCHSGKHLVLPGNYQAGALEEISQHFDALLYDQPVDANLPATLPIQLPTHSDSKVAQLTCLTPESIRLTLFTSGSSGTPKAIHKHLGLLDVEIQQLHLLWGDQLTDCRVVSTVSHQHIYGLLFRLLWPLCAERPFATENLIYPEQVMAEATPNTWLISSPALLKRLGNEAAQDKYRMIFSSGGPLPLTAADDCQRLFNLRPMEIFGSTETGGIAFRQQQEQRTPWQLFPGHGMRLAADAGIVLKSSFIPAEDCQQGWYHTSDRAELIGDHQFRLLGRTDRVVKIEEKRISLTEVERHLTNLEWLEEAAALPLDDGKRLSIAAVISLSDSGKAEIARLGKGKFNLALRSKLRSYLEPVGIPRRFRIVEQIPVNSQGKRLYQALVQLFSDQEKENNKMVRVLPQILHSDVQGNTARIELQPDADLLDFQGHFPQFALLPGVTQIDWAIRFAAALLSTDGRFAGMEVIKFQEPITPGARVTLELSWAEDKQKLTFSYSSPLGMHSSGRIKLEPNA